MVCKEIEWKDIPGFEKRYQASRDGQIRSLPKQNGVVFFKTNRILKPSLDRRGYKQVVLYKEGKAITRSVHRLVALTFIPNTMGKRTVNHIDKNKLNNCVENLEWATDLENITHSLGRKIKQSQKGVLIKIWPSIASAGRQKGFQSTGIWEACSQHRASYNGFEWAYVE